MGRYAARARKGGEASVTGSLPKAKSELSSAKSAEPTKVVPACDADVPHEALVLHLPKLCKRVKDRLITRPVDNRLLTRRYPVCLSFCTERARMVPFLSRANPSRHELCVMQIYNVEIIGVQTLEAALYAASYRRGRVIKRILPVTATFGHLY